MKYYLGTLHLLVILALIYAMYQMNLLSPVYTRSLGVICLVVGVFLGIKLLISYRSGRIKTAIVLSPVFLFRPRYKEDNTIWGTVFDKATNPERFKSAFRSSLFVSITFILVGLIILF